MKFNKWILQFENENSPNGDLTRDIKVDEDFPNTKLYSKISDYLNSKGAYYAFMYAFDEAYLEYEKFLNNNLKKLSNQYEYSHYV